MQEDRKNVLVLSFTDHATDPRVNRQLTYLKRHHNVISAGVVPSQFDDIEFVPLEWNQPTKYQQRIETFRLLTRQYESAYWSYPYVADALNKLANVKFDVVVANDIETLPMALRVAGDRPVIFDAHEYSPLEFEDLWKFRLLQQGYKTHLCKTYMPKAFALTTVCETISKRYGTDIGRQPRVLLNAPRYENLTPSITKSDKIRLIHHGAPILSRKLETMVEMMQHLDERFELHFMMPRTNPTCFERLEPLAQKVGRTYFHDAVPMLDIAQATNQFDIGLFLLPPVNFNYRHALPNKLFEFIQARLAVAIGPSPEMAAVVNRHRLGVIASDFTPLSMAKTLNGLSQEDIVDFKSNADAVAEKYCAEVECGKLNQLVESALDSEFRRDQVHDIRQDNQGQPALTFG